MFNHFGPQLLLIILLSWSPMGFAADSPRNIGKTVEHDTLPLRVHVFEDYETEIEKRWWLRGELVTDKKLLPPSLSATLPNTRVCRATLTKDFDRKMGDQSRRYKAVIFNPVPGPPMGDHTRLFFRYRLSGTNKLRVQIYSLVNGYHRHLVLTDLPQNKWQTATVDMTQARRPDGSGGPLARDERIDDIQFYIDDLDAELLIDDIVLYDAGPQTKNSEEKIDHDKKPEPFPRRVIFTGWFDTGKQGKGKEWPGDFKIALHDKVETNHKSDNQPRMWDRADSVVNQQTGKHWLRIHMRGRRPLSEMNRLFFRFTHGGKMRVSLYDSKTRYAVTQEFILLTVGKWSESYCDFKIEDASKRFADEIRFELESGMLSVDDVLLYEPGKE